MSKYAFVTNAGDRKVNEDAVGVYESGANMCFVLCDGLGGHGMGDIASVFVRDFFAERFKSADKMSKFPGNTFSAAQKALLEKQKSCGAEKKMKTTAVVLVTDKKKAYIGHIGDSRLYVFYKGKIKFRTLDHSLLQMLVLSGELKEEEIRDDPDRNMLLRVMGVAWEKPMYELAKPLSLRKCQAFLLCSDGFWELIDEKDMCECLNAASDPEEWLAAMVEIVKKNGAGRHMDNYSAIAAING